MKYNNKKFNKFLQATSPDKIEDYRQSRNYKLQPCKGFTLLELMIVIGIIGAIAFFSWINLSKLGRGQELNDATRAVVSVIRDAQQRSITQADGLYCGIRFQNNAVGRDIYFLYRVITPPTITDSSSLEAVSLTTLKSSLNFLQPSAAAVSNITFNKISGELVSPNCPSVSNSLNVEVSSANDPSSTKLIKIYCNGRIEF